MIERYKEPRCYYGYHNNDALLKKASSGGLATLLAMDMIKNGGVVYGVVYSADFKGVEYLRATKPSDLIRIRGTKYADVNPVCDGINVYEAVLSDLRNGIKVLFVGLPCMVGALVKRAERECVDRSLITIDLICHGPTSKIVLKQYVEMMEKKYKSNIIDMAVRYKKNGQWTPPYMKLLFANGKKHVQPYTSTEFAYAFRIMTQERCFACRFKGCNHLSDITVGDYWGVKKEDEGYNPHGVSVALVHSDRGNQLLHDIRDFKLFKTTFERVAKGNPYYSNSIKKDAKRELFEKKLISEGIKLACRSTMSPKEKMRRFIPQALIDAFHQIRK